MPARGWWKSPNVGPWLHGLAMFLVTDGYPITEYVYNRFLLADPQAPFNAKLFFTGLAATAVATMVSMGRNNRAVELTNLEVGIVKGTDSAQNGPAVVVPAAEVVHNTEQVLILKGRPPVGEAAL